MSRVRCLVAAATAVVIFPIVHSAEAAQAPGGDRFMVDVAKLPARQRDYVFKRIIADPYAYFRFLNRPFSQRVCEAFRGNLQGMPSVDLHGDLHIEQYAFTDTQRGLDDFDDTARGPAVMDMVRLLSSIDLGLRARGWAASRDVVENRFFEGYRKGLTDPSFVGPEPAVVGRVRRERPAKTQEEFLEWTGSLMQPLSDGDKATFGESRSDLAEMMHELRPTLPDIYFNLKQAGWLQMGLGSALTPKILVRFEGPTTLDEDDVIAEAKELSLVSGIDCIATPSSGEVFRVIQGANRVGGLKHDLIAIMPRRPGQARTSRDWWVRSWERDYREVDLKDFRNADEMGDIAYDIGVQLAHGHLPEGRTEADRQVRYLQRKMLDVEPEIRRVAHRITGELLASWEQFRKRNASRIPVSQ